MSKQGTLVIIQQMKVGMPTNELDCYLKFKKTAR